MTKSYQPVNRLAAYFREIDEAIDRYQREKDNPPSKTAIKRKATRKAAKAAAPEADTLPEAPKHAPRKRGRPRKATATPKDEKNQTYNDSLRAEVAQLILRNPEAAPYLRMALHLLGKL